MPRFHEGQDVQVAEIRGDPRPFRVWRKAKIGRAVVMDLEAGRAAYLVQFPDGRAGYLVQFPDGSCDVVDVEHIRMPKLVLDVSHADDFINEAKP